jgi:hypothetical protein
VKQQQQQQQQQQLWQHCMVGLLRLQGLMLAAAGNWQTLPGT